MKGARLALTFSLAALVASFAPALSQTQPSPPAKARGPQFAWPERMRNAQVLPADIGPDRLRDVMRNFAMSLGVRCTFCHIGPEGAPLTGLDFASDANPHKNAARAMMRMVAQLNNQTLPAIPDLHHPQVTCYTCHRGDTSPATAPPETPATPAQPQPVAAIPPAHEHASPHEHPAGERGAR